VKAFLDVETTGFTPGQIAQLTYIITDDDLHFIKAKNYYFSVDTMPQGATAVHGLTKVKLRKLSNNQGFFDNAREILDDLQDCDVICHNTEFDASFIRAEFYNLGLKPPKSFSGCTMKHFTNICRLRGGRNGQYKWPKLEEVLTHTCIMPDEILETAKSMFDCDTIGFHDSRYDAVAVYLICSKGMTKEQLAEMETAYREVAATRREVASTTNVASSASPTIALKQRKPINWMTAWLVVSVIAAFGQPLIGVPSLLGCAYFYYRRHKKNT